MYPSDICVDGIVLGLHFAQLQNTQLIFRAHHANAGLTLPQEGPNPFENVTTPVERGKLNPDLDRMSWQKDDQLSTASCSLDLKLARPG